MDDLIENVERLFVEKSETATCVNEQRPICGEGLEHADDGLQRVYIIKEDTGCVSQSEEDLHLICGVLSIADPFKILIYSHNI